jgi:hypothetical protein
MGQVKRLIEEQERGNPIAKIDFTDLRNQKRNLLDVINKVTNQSLNNPDNAIVTVEEVNSLDAILHLIDAIQDYAVDELGWDQMMVFDFEDEENREF